MSHPSAKNSLNRIPELDGLRGIAILLVLFYHFFWFPSPGWDWTGLAYGLWRFAQVGWIGVSIFFVLSGFLITRILIAEKDQPRYFFNFYRRRILRIFPLYLLTLLFVYFYFPDSGKFILLSFLFLAQAPHLFQIKNVYPVLWSLSVEEQFYLAWPWIVKKLSLPHLLSLCMGVTCVGPILRGVHFLKGADFPWLVFFTSFDGFTVGGILALSFFSGSTSADLLRKGKILGTIGLLMSVLLMPWGLYTRTQLIGEMFLPTALYLYMGSVMAFCMVFSGKKVLKGLSKGWLPRWGKFSYAAYLCHHAVFDGVDWALQRLPINPSLFEHIGPCLIRAALLIAVTYVASYALYYVVERPFLKLSKKNLQWFGFRKQPQLLENKF